MKTKKIVTSQSQTIRSNTTIMPDGFSGWLAMNIGTGNVEVDGHLLKPGMKLDFTSIPIDVVWNSAIPIVVSTGGLLRITRLKYAQEGKA